MAAKGGTSRKPGLIASLFPVPVVSWVLVLHWSTAHAILAAALYVLYLAVVKAARIVGGFAAKVWGVVSDRLAISVGEYVIQRLSRSVKYGKFEQAYRGYVKELCGLADQSGFPSIAPKALALDDVFVDVSLVVSAPQQMRPGLVNTEPDGAARRQVWDFLDEKPRPVKLAIIGEPGSGKSTLLRHIALHADGPHGERRRRTLPVILQIRECAVDITGDHAPGLPTVIADRLHRLPNPPPASWVEKQLTDGRCIVMLDGLDEVANQRDRQAVVSWIEEQMTFFPSNDYLVTSRLYGYRDNLLRKADQLLIREFTSEQVKSFIRGWYRATGRLLPAGGNHEAESLADADAESEDLIGRLEDNAALGELAVNPLLLTMIAIVHRYNKGKLPDTRADLYAEMCEVLLERPPHAKPLPEPLPPGRKEMVLRDLAFAMMSDRTFDLAETDAIELIGRSLASTTSLSPSIFLENACANGLVVRSDGACSFAHPTFQEYLAAAAVGSAERQQILVTNIGDPWWRETVLLYSSRAGAGVIVEAALASGQFDALTVAVECADADARLDPSLRERLNALLIDANNPDAPADRRKLGAALTATRELGKTVKLANGTRVCAAPVTRRLYELFTHQKNDEFPIGLFADVPRVQAGEPAVGVTGAEAEELVKWINGLRSGDMAYRLPTRAETVDPRFPGNTLVGPRSVWLAAEGDPPGPALWCAPGTPHPHEIRHNYLLERLAADTAGALSAPLAAVLSLALAHSLAAADTLMRTYTGTRTRSRPDLALNVRLELELVSKLYLELVGKLAAHPSDPAQQRIAALLDGVLARAGRPDPARDLGGGMLSHAVALDLVQVRAHELAAALRVALRDVLDWEFTPRLPKPGGRAADTASHHSQEFNQAFDRDLDLACVDRTMSLDSSPMATSGLDVAFCALFTRNVSPERDPRETLDLIRAPRLLHVVATPEKRTIVPELLRPLVADGLVKIGDLPANPGDEHLRKRMATVAARIDVLIAALDGDDPAYLETVVPHVRFGALVIAAGACRLAVDPTLASRYVDIAAGVTAVERRATGGVTPSEVVILVQRARSQ